MGDEKKAKKAKRSGGGGEEDDRRSRRRRSNRSAIADSASPSPAKAEDDSVASPSAAVGEGKDGRSPPKGKKWKAARKKMGAAQKLLPPKPETVAEEDSVLQVRANDAQADDAQVVRERGEVGESALGEVAASSAPWSAIHVGGDVPVSPIQVVVSVATENTPGAGPSGLSRTDEFGEHPSDGWPPGAPSDGGPADGASGGASPSNKSVPRLQAAAKKAMLREAALKQLQRLRDSEEGEEGPPGGADGAEREGSSSGPETAAIPRLQEAVLELQRKQANRGGASRAQLVLADKVALMQWKQRVALTRRSEQLREASSAGRRNSSSTGQRLSTFSGFVASSPSPAEDAPSPRDRAAGEGPEDDSTREGSTARRPADATGQADAGSVSAQENSPVPFLRSALMTSERKREKRRVREKARLDGCREEEDFGATHAAGHDGDARRFTRLNSVPDVLLFDGNTAFENSITAGELSAASQQDMKKIRKNMIWQSAGCWKRCFLSLGRTQSARVLSSLCCLALLACVTAALVYEMVGGGGELFEMETWTEFTG